MDWKDALALEWSDPGVDGSAPCPCRARLMTNRTEIQLVDQILAHLHTPGLLKGRGYQGTDSTHVRAAARTLDRLERGGEPMHHTLNVLAKVAPDGLRLPTLPAWGERSGRRMEHDRFPKAEEAAFQL